MTLTTFLNLFLADPAASAKTALRFLHFLGLAIGLGGATLLDLVLLRFFVRSRIEGSTYDFFAFSTRLVDIGLKILWVTGIGFLFHYALFDPEKLTNPKVHAKLAIVTILTMNGMFIHHVILPHVKAQIGRTLFQGVSAVRRSVFLVSGAISAVSWYCPVALGAFSQLNYKVPALTLLGIYGTLIAIAVVAMHIVVLALDPRRAPHPQASRAGWAEAMADGSATIEDFADSIGVTGLRRGDLLRAWHLTDPGRADEVEDDDPPTLSTGPLIQRTA